MSLLYCSVQKRRRQSGKVSKGGIQNRIKSSRTFAFLLFFPFSRAAPATPAGVDDIHVVHVQRCCDHHDGGRQARSQHRRRDP